MRAPVNTIRTTTLLAAGAMLALALIAAPLGDLSVATTAAAYECPITGDVKEDLACRQECTGPFDPKRPLEWLKPRMCPDE